MNEYEENEYYEDKSINETTKQNFVDDNNYYWNRESQSKNFRFEENFQKRTHTNKNDESKINFVATFIITFQCRRCNAEFKSNNKLHRHVKICDEFESLNVSTKNYHFDDKKKIFIIESIVTKSSKFDYNFRRWHYVKIKIMHTSKNESKKICLNTNCIMFVIDRQYLNITQSNIEIKKTA